MNSNVDGGYGTFGLEIRKFDDRDVGGTGTANGPQVIESYLGLNLDPSSENYIARRIGSQNIYYDFDQTAAEQKLVIDGNHINLSSNIRAEVASAVNNATIDKTALPCGFQGPNHLVTSGSSIFLNNGFPIIKTHAGKTTSSAGSIIKAGTFGQQLTVPPIPMRQGLWENDDGSNSKTLNASYYWGMQFTVVDNIKQPNASTVLNPSMGSFTKYFPNFATIAQKSWIGDNVGATDSSGTVYDCDRFNNNKFSLEKIQIHTKSTADVVASDEWAFARYRRSGVLSASMRKADNTWNQGRFLNASKDFGDTSSTDFLKFSFFIQGGFNGVDIFNKDRANLLNVAAAREMDDSVQGQSIGPTVATYLKAIDVMAERSDVDINILAIPGLRETKITNHAIDKTEDRFDAIYIMDIEQRDTDNNVITGAFGNELKYGQKVIDPDTDATNIIPGVSVGNTVTDLKNRNLDSSFAAAYFPDVEMLKPIQPTAGTATVRVPPSVAILGAYSYNDAVANPWNPPAGFTRAVLATTVAPAVNLSVNNMDTLYDADVNMIQSFPDSPGPVVWGNKTLLAAASALDRINVRRLLIDIRRKVRKIGDTFLFEPNRESTLAKFSAAVNPKLQFIQQQGGLDRFKVIIDTTTTTQADVENNTIRGKIFLQPTRSVEFISLDFVIKNAGTEV